jgi:hypothetical protein
VIGSGFGKYLLYAIGEIILVAISINDHYAEKRVQKKTEEISWQILHQMINDYERIDDYIQYLSDLEATIEYYRTPIEDRKKLVKPLKDVNKLGLFFDRKNNFLIIGDMVSTQISNYDFSAVDYAPLLYSIQADYAYGIKSLEQQENAIRQRSDAFNKMLEEKYEWYRFFMEKINCKNECTQYIRFNPEFDKELIAFKYDKTFVYRVRIEEFQYLLKENIEVLEEELQTQ